jgi:hypothetical protein
MLAQGLNQLWQSLDNRIAAAKADCEYIEVPPEALFVPEFILRDLIDSNKG